MGGQPDENSDSYSLVSYPSQAYQSELSRMQMDRVERTAETLEEAKVLLAKLEKDQQESYRLLADDGGNADGSLRSMIQ